MLPILRTITAGGVFLALTIFLLALIPPDRARKQLARIDAPAHGPLIDRATHPEWRQLLLLAAFRRAAELKELRELPNTPVHRPPPSAPVAATENKPADHVAALPQNGQADGELDLSSPTIPVGIGEASSTELPVMPHQDQPPVITPRDESDVPSLPMSPSAPSQTTKQEKPDKPPAVASKPPESDAPAQTVAPKRQGPAMRPETPEKPTTNASKPQPGAFKPHAGRAAPPERPRRAVRHHTRTTKSATTSDQPAPFDLFGLLAGSLKADANHPAPNNPVTAHK